MRRFVKTLLIPIALGTALGACVPISRNHGFVTTKENPGDVENGVDTKTTVLSKYGNPSITGTFDKSTWYYMSELREQLGYLRPRATSRTITAIQFSQAGVVDDVTVYSLKDGNIVSLVGRKTPTRGRELSVLEQLLGTVGRVPTGTITDGANLPGGAGGPRRQ